MVEDRRKCRLGSPPAQPDDPGLEDTLRQLREEILSEGVPERLRQALQSQRVRGKDDPDDGRS